MEKTKTESQARQGPKGKPVLYVLIASLVLLAIYMVGVLTWSGSTAPPDRASQSQDSARETATGANKAAGSSASGETGGNPSPAQPKAN